MTTAQVVETSVTVKNNGPIQDYVHADDQTRPTFEKNFSPVGLPTVTKKWWEIFWLQLTPDNSTF